MTHEWFHAQVTGGSGSAVQINGTDKAGQMFVVIKAPSTNTGVVYIGKTGVTASTGFPLAAGEQLGPIPHDALSDLYMFSAGTDKVAVLALGKGMT